MRLKHPNFLQRNPLLARLWLSRFLNANGAGIGQFAIQWVATAFPQPAIALAYSNTLGRISQVFSLYIIGWLSDNISPVLLMILGNLFGGIFTIGMGLLLRQYHTLPLLLALVVVWTAFSLTSSAASKLVPQMTDKSNLPRVNSFMGMIAPLQQFLASGLGGILIAAGIMHAFIAAAIAMGLAAGSLVTKKRWPSSSQPRQIQPRSVSLGIRTVFGDHTLRRMVTFISLLNFGFSFYLGDYLLFLRRTDHLSAASIGVGSTLATVGTGMALILGPMVLRRRIKITVMVTPVVMAVGIILISLWTGISGFVIGAALVEIGAGVSGQYVSLIRQRTVPIEVMGSVAGALSMFQTILVPLGMALAGVVASRWGVQVTLFVSGTLVLIALIPSIPLAISVEKRLRAA